LKTEGILARLEGVRLSRIGWMARCPAHDDRNPSLSIREPNGKVLLNCFAGCTVEAICASLRIKVSALFPERRKSRSKTPPILRSAERQIVGLRSRLTRPDRERSVTVVLATRETVDAAIARALALTVEGDLVQVTLKEDQK
jgi:hypothetical protein